MQYSNINKPQKVQSTLYYYLYSSVRKDEIRMRLFWFVAQIAAMFIRN